MIKWVVGLVLLVLLLVILMRRRAQKRADFGPVFPLSGAPELVAKQVEWPPLADFAPFVGKAATRDDVGEDRAVFALEGMGVGVGTPMPMELPQYAFHVEPSHGRRTAVVIVQAEKAEQGIEIVGYKSLDGKSSGAALLSEFELLGTEEGGGA